LRDGLEAEPGGRNDVGGCLFILLQRQPPHLNWKHPKLHLHYRDHRQQSVNNAKFH